MNEITTTTQAMTEVEAIEKAKKWLQTSGMVKSLTNDEQETFLELCSAFSLNPFKREIYAVKYKDKMSLITGYEVYLKRAERSGRLDGWEVSTTGSVIRKSNDRGFYIAKMESSLKATVTLYRKDWKHPFKHEVSISEFCGSSPNWVQMPEFMLKKVCISQAFRLCFPDEFGGLPYTQEEHDVLVDDDEYPKDLSAYLEKAQNYLTIKKDADIIYLDIKSAVDDGDESAAKKYLKQLEKAPLLDSLSGYSQITESKIVETPNAQSEPISEAVVQLMLRAEAGAEKVFSNNAHKKASIKKHLGVDQIQDCQDADLLEAYVKRLLITWKINNASELTDDDKRVLSKSLSDCSDDLLSLNQFEVDMAGGV
jgi:phage recombination protein Bet